jgi:hypothetical protein
MRRRPARAGRVRHQGPTFHCVRSPRQDPHRRSTGHVHRRHAAGHLSARHGPAHAPAVPKSHITETVTFDGDGASIVGRYQENVGRVAAAEVVAAAIVFLAPDAASSISGAVLPSTTAGRPSDPATHAVPGPHIGAGHRMPMPHEVVSRGAERILVRARTRHRTGCTSRCGTVRPCAAAVTSDDGGGRCPGGAPARRGCGCSLWRRSASAAASTPAGRG